MTLNAEDETLRFPTNLTHGDIVRRLVHLRRDARSNGLPEIAEQFMEVESMSAAQIASRVIAAMTWLQDKNEHSALTTRLEMIAMNLKNLR